MKGGRQILTEPAFISLGSNIEPESNLIAAAVALRGLGLPQAASNVYRNPAIGPTPQPEFLNAAVLLNTDVAAQDIRQMLRQIEGQLGRQRTSDKYAPRTIDLDLCLFGNHIINQGEIRVPDPEIETRAHLAVPLAELDPQFIHPILEISLEEIASRLAPHKSLELMKDVSTRFQQSFLKPTEKVNAG